MVLAAAVCPDTCISGQRPERHAVFHTTEVAGDVEGAADVRAPLRVVIDASDAYERRRDTDDERARTAHSGCSRQIAFEHDVGAERRSGKIAREPPGDDFSIVTPAGVHIG